MTRSIWQCVFLAVLIVTGTATAHAEVVLNAAVVGSGPYYLDVPGETYVLSEDLTTTGSGFVFAAPNVTLNLNGHTLTFGTSPSMYRYGVAVAPPYAHVNPMWSQSDITAWRQSSGATVLNGTIIQGSGRGANCAALIGDSQRNLTVRDVSILIHGDDTFAIRLIECGGLHISGNTITDSTTVITNRHQGRAVFACHLAVHA